MNIFALPIVCMLIACSASAQSLPPPARTIYKCEVEGKALYSDSPCLGAKKIDAEPTRGVNKLSGKERIGPDVQNEQIREIWAEGLRPITGMNAKQLDVAGRRMKLTPATQRKCQVLDQEIPLAERAERHATQPGELKSAQNKLFLLRTDFRNLGCE